ncbi:MAG: hypothetical protein ACYSWU_17565, partial [Planctomycetota bacterium]
SEQKTVSQNGIEPRRSGAGPSSQRTAYQLCGHQGNRDWQGKKNRVDRTQAEYHQQPVSKVPERIDDYERDPTHNPDDKPSRETCSHKRPKSRDNAH